MIKPREIGDDARTYGRRRGSSKCLVQRGDHGHGPAFVGEPQGRLETPVVEQGSQERGFIPGAEGANRLPHRPRGENIRIAEGAIESRGRRGVAEPAQRDRRLAPHRRVAIAQ